MACEGRSRWSVAGSPQITRPFAANGRMIAGATRGNICAFKGMGWVCRWCRTGVGCGTFGAVYSISS